MEPISLFLDSFIELVDRIINLEKTKRKDEREAFNEIVKPLFEGLEPVASDYVAFFRNARGVISNCQKNQYQEVGIKLLEDRNVLRIERIKVREMATQINEHIKDENINNFAKAVRIFFMAYYSDNTYSPMSARLLYYFNDRSQTDIPERDKKILIIYIDNVLIFLERSWASIVQSYEKLRILSITPSKFVRKSQTKKTKSQ